MRYFGRLICCWNYLLVDLFKLFLEDCVVMAYCQVLNIVLELFHRLRWKFTRRRRKPISKHCQFILVFLKKLDIYMSLFIFFFLIKTCNLFLNIFYDGEYFLPILSLLFLSDISNRLYFLQILLDSFLSILNTKWSTVIDFFNASETVSLDKLIKLNK